MNKNEQKADAYVIFFEKEGRLLDPEGLEFLADNILENHFCMIAARNEEGVAIGSGAYCFIATVGSFRKVRKQQTMAKLIGVLLIEVEEGFKWQKCSDEILLSILNDEAIDSEEVLGKVVVSRMNLENEEV